MARSYIEYRKLLQSLLPRGRAWTRAEDSDLTRLLNGLADELVRVEDRSLVLISESHPSLTTSLIDEYIQDFALPDPGLELPESEDKKQALIYSKYLSKGEQDKTYFISIAGVLLYTITIKEFIPSLAGIATAGESEIVPERGIFYWLVYVHDVTYTKSNISQLAYDIQRVQPAHAMVLFRLYGGAFSDAFDWSFPSLPWYDAEYPLDFSRDFSSAFANAYDYNGVRLTGAYANAFSLDFDSARGGDFEFGTFSTDFLMPS